MSRQLTEFEERKVEQLVVALERAEDTKPRNKEAVQIATNELARYLNTLSRNG